MPDGWVTDWNFEYAHQTFRSADYIWYIDVTNQLYYNVKN